MDQMPNKRDFIRAPVSVEVEAMSSDGKTIGGPAVDVSVKGVCFESTEALPTGTQCEVALNLAGGENPVTALAKGIVARVDERRIAIEFTETDPESLQHLRNLVRYNSPDVGHVEEEFDGSVGLKRREGSDLRDF